jgi:hypothetical protein
MTEKIFDAVILINIIDECSFPDVLRSWSSNPRYKLWIPHEVNLEVKGAARNELDLLLDDKILHILPPVEGNKLKDIQKHKPKLSLADCSVYYHCVEIEGALALTNDRNLRNFLELNAITFHGTKAIYDKLIFEKTFPLDQIEERFARIKENPRIFPENV